ncbi:MAG: RNase adapter RapZ [Candidatus Eremiobacteraeota bacterium]|nr:RNase adapter RapZ [Candidatus Eremiobacteraeota bacterium]
MSFQRFVIVAGLSGAGKSQAMKSLEDLGFHCIDNMPPKLTIEIVELCEKAGVKRLALALDVRSHGPLGEAGTALAQLDAHGIPYELLFLDASDDALVRRYSETRRRHPFSSVGALTDAIDAERRAVADLRARADRIWDTSGMNHAMLKARIAAAYAEGPNVPRLDVRLVSFGFKFGVPVDADLVFDVRFFPNPNYVPELRNLTGADEDVRRFLDGLPITQPFFERLFALVDFLIPLYVEEGKSRLTIAVGCTGGQHRSVYVVQRLAEHLRATPDISVSGRHRETHSAPVAAV